MTMTTYLYVIKCSDELETFYKIGITSREDPTHRFYQIPYNITLMRLYSHPHQEFILDLEKKLLSMSERYKPLKEFCGQTECVLYPSDALEYLESLDWIRGLRPVPHKKTSVSKMLREYQSLTDELEIEEFLDNNPEFDSWLDAGVTIANMYSLGKDRDKIDALAEANRRLSQSEVIQELGLEVGDVYPAQELKQKIQAYYDSNGIPKRAKGTDVTRWFEVKRVSITKDDTRVSVIKLTSLRERS